MPHIQIEHWFSWNCMFYLFNHLAIWSVVALRLVCFLLRVAIRWLIMSIFLNIRLVRKSEREDLSWQRKCRYFRVGVWIVRFGIFGHICYKYKKYTYILCSYPRTILFEHVWQDINLLSLASGWHGPFHDTRCSHT